MLTQKVAIKTVERFIKEVNASGIRIKRAVLYGSYAHGKPNKWSDIDVALVADQFKGIGHNDQRFLHEIREKPEYIDISPRTYNTKEFSPIIDPFVEVIMDRGIEIAVK